MSARSRELWDEVVQAEGRIRLDLMDRLVEALLLEVEVDAAVAVKRQQIDDFREAEMAESWCAAQYELAVLFRNQECESECFEVLELLVENLECANTVVASCAHTLFGQLNNERLQWARAEIHFRQAVSLLAIGERESLKALANWGLAEALFSQGKLEESIESYDTSIDLYGLAREPEMVLDVTIELAEQMELAGMARRARKRFEDALTLARYLELAEVEQTALHSLARLHLSWQEFDMAERLLKTVVGMKSNLCQRIEGVAARYTLSALRRAQGRLVEAIELERQAQVIGRALGL